jgi:phytanoyl-CoA hydroxylase
LNKIGHAIHDLDPVFQSFSYHEKFKAILKALDYKDPALVQSMYIFKSSKIGYCVYVRQRVDPHTDNTYIITQPHSTVGIWVAIEDATVDNGCLWGVPGSHRIKTTKVF